MPERADLGPALAAFAERRWEDACTLLGAADRAQPLGAAQLELLARAAALCGRDETAFDAQSRAYHRYLDAPEPAVADELSAARAAFWIGYRLGSLHERGRSRAWLARAAELAGRHDDCVESGYLLLPGIHHLLHSGDSAGAVAAASAAVDIGRRHGDTELQALGTQLRGRALLDAGERDAAVDAFGEAMLLAADEGVSELPRGLVYCAVLDGCQSAFALERAREWAAVLSEWALPQPQLSLFTGRCRVHRAELLQLGGTWQAALEEADAVSGNPRSGEHERGAAGYQRAEVHRLRGEMPAAEAAYKLAHECGIDPHPGLALLWLAQGRVADAAAAIRRVLATTGPPLARARVLPAAVEIGIAQGSLVEVAADVAELAGIAAAFPSRMLRTLADQARGQLALAEGAAGAALAPLRAAQNGWSELGAPYFTAQLRATIAIALAALGDEEGARWERAAADAVYLRLGAASPAPKPAGPLTERELQVLRLAASGLTNKAIASELTLSVRTVDRHMSELFRRLGVPSRAAATAYAYEHGLLGD